MTLLEVPQISILAVASRANVEAVANLSSIEAITARAGHAIYGASKAALEALTRSAAAELAPMRVNALRLGLIGRPRIEEDWPEGVRSWCTGANLNYDGGMSAVSPW